MKIILTCGPLAGGSGELTVCTAVFSVDALIVVNFALEEFKTRPCVWLSVEQWCLLFSCDAAPRPE